MIDTFTKKKLRGRFFKLSKKSASIQNNTNFFSPTQTYNKNQYIGLRKALNNQDIYCKFK